MQAKYLFVFLRSPPAIGVIDDNKFMKERLQSQVNRRSSSLRDVNCSNIPIPGMPWAGSFSATEIPTSNYPGNLSTEPNSAEFVYSGKLSSNNSNTAETVCHIRFPGLRL